MKRILNKGKVIVSMVSVLAILAVSLLSMFTGVSFVASAEDETDADTVTYPLNGTYDADYTEVTTPGITYESVDYTKKTRVDSFTGYDYDFCIDPDTEGDGTANSPYIIKTANQFAAVVTGNLKDSSGSWMSTDGVSFRIADDVRAFNLNNTGSSLDFAGGNLTTSDLATAFASATVSSDLKWENKSGVPFMGRFDGNGATVYGLVINDGSYAGIFPLTKGNVKIKNISVTLCYFKANTVAAIVGKHEKTAAQEIGSIIVENSSVTDCYLESVGTGANDAVAAIIGFEDNCYSIGGIYYNGRWDIKNCYVNLQSEYFISKTAADNTVIRGGVLGRATTNGDCGNGAKPNVKDCIVIGITPYSTTKNTNFGNIQHSGLNQHFGNIYTDQQSGIVNIGHTFTTMDFSSVITQLSAEQLKGSNAVDAMNLDWGNAWEKPAEGEYPTPKIYKVREYSAGKTWSGEQAVQYGGGDGTSASPYTISTAEELALMLTQPVKGAYYKLVADIVINDTSAENWTATAKKWFTSNDVPTFEASLDGNGYTVSGIYYDGSQAGENVGLIPVVGNTAEIRNITIANSVINAKKGNAGAVAGAVAEKCAKIVKFDTVTVDDTVKFEGKADSAGIIGKVGYSILEMNDCISKSNGLLGSVAGEARVKRSISLGAYPFANTDNIKAENVYTDTEGAGFDGVTVVSADNMIGENAATNMPGLNFPTSWETTDFYPVPTGVAASAEGEVGKPWTGAIATKYASGTGTEDDPYIINTAEQLAYFVTKTTTVSGSYRYYKLGADIYLNDVDSKFWEEKIGCTEWFSYTDIKSALTYIDFDGDGYVVYGLYYDSSASAGAYVRVGLFPEVNKNLTVRNLGLSSVYLNGRVNDSAYRDVMGALIGCVENYDDYMEFDPNDATTNKEKLQDTELNYEEAAVKVKNCFIDHRSYISAYCSGGFFGEPWSAPIIENCIFTGEIGGHQDKYFTGLFTGVDSTYGSQIRSSIAFPITTQVPLIGGSGGASHRTSPEYKVTTATATYYFNLRQQYGADFIKISNPDQRVGEEAKEAMPLLDWVNTWRTVDGGTPLLTIFDKHRTQAEVDANLVKIDDAEYFSLKDFTPPNTTLTFSTGDPDITVAPIVAPMYSALTLPTISRQGYDFLGWYVFEDPAVLYDLGYQPARDLTLHAAWSKKGVTQNFEDYPYTMWDCDSDYWILNKPGAKGGYKVDYFRNGSKSMHLLGTNTEPVDLLLNYEDMLEPGKSYTMTFWVNTDKADNDAVLLSLVHNSKPDYLNSAVAVENMAVVTGLKVGEWVQYSYSFTAQTKWVSLRATGGASLWFDDIVMAELDDTLEGGKFIGLGANGAAGGSLSPNTGDVVSVAVLISAIMSCAVIAVVSRKNLVEVIED